MWRAHIEGDIRHVYPDDEVHNISDTIGCGCEPVSTVIGDGIILVVHNSYDGREYIERLVASITPN